jgi:hypothetical protein
MEGGMRKAESERASARECGVGGEGERERGSHSKAGYAAADPKALLDVICAASAAAVAAGAAGWLPFTFLRPLALRVVLARIARRVDFPE